MSHKVYTLTREQVREICPSCADKMQLSRIKSLKLSADELGNLLPDDETTIKLFTGFSQGLCNKFDAETKGFFTRCAETMAGKVEDEKGFCASLEKYCTGDWPATAAAKKKHADDSDYQEYIDKREDVYPNAGKDRYGDVKFADEKNKKYPIDTEEHIRAAWNYIHKANNAGKYNSEDLATIKDHIVAAWKKTIDKAGPPSAEDQKNHAVVALKNMTRQQVAAKCPDCAGKMAGNSQDMPVDAGGHMQHICGKGGRAIANMEEEMRVAEYANAIKGVEIFKTGTHNGDVYTEKDLDDMVEAFKVLDYRPAIKIGHTKDKPGSPAYGWVQNVSRDGDKLRADFTDLHDSVVDAIRNKSYDRVSSEIYFNLKRGGKDYRRALKAVALLGAEVPAVAGLTPLHKMEFAEEGFEKVGVMEQELNVPSQAIVDTLAERVAVLVNLMKEHDMSKNSEKIAELKASVDELNEQIVALNAAGKHSVAKKGEMYHLMDPAGTTVSKHNSMADALAAKKKADADAEDAADGGADEAKENQIKELSEQADALEQQIRALEIEENTAGAVAELSEQLAASKAREEAANKEAKALANRVARIEQERRYSEVAAKVEACKIPAFRNSLKAVYTYALEHADAVVKVYSKDKEGKDTSADKTLVDVIDGVVTEINAQSEKLFKALAFSGTTLRPDGSTEEDAGAEIQKRVADYRSKHPEVKKYEQAMAAVLQADTELAQRYREQLGQEQ